MRTTLTWKQMEMDEVELKHQRVCDLKLRNSFRNSAVADALQSYSSRYYHDCSFAESFILSDCVLNRMFTRGNRGN